MNFSFSLKDLMVSLIFGAVACQVSAQSWPVKPISMVVPWPAGGPTDFVARKIQPDMARALGQPVVIDNVGGAGGAIGVQKNLNAPADGKIKVLGLASRLPLTKFPNIPALALHPKLQGFEFDSWGSVAVPRGTPDAVSNRINKAAYDALQNPETRAAFEATGNMVVNPTSVTDLDRLYREEISRYQAIAKSINFEPQ
jgi:tripartite-type tricarboxylate transporter receptor subunit TctC